MKMYAVKVNMFFVTFGENREYFLEEVSLEEAAYFDEEQVQNVADYFESEIVELIEVEVEMEELV